MATKYVANYHDNNTSSPAILAKEGRKEFLIELNRLVTDRQWDEVDRLLANLNETSSVNHASQFLTCENEMIHHACENHAPLDILRSLTKVYNCSVSSSNCSGRYPLHVAAKSGTHPDVIEYLCQLNSDAAKKQDNLGRTPMHYAAKYYAKQYRSRHIEGGKKAIVEANECMLRVVRILQEAAPHSFNLEDRDGKNPIEYAIESEANIHVFKCIHRVCRDDLRSRSKNIGVSHNISIKGADSFDKCNDELMSNLTYTAKTA